MRKKAKSPREPRVRRTREAARTAILDATEKRLIASGRAGIRLQDVAADVGVSHPTVLHHFGSRERLVEAVIKRRVAALNQEVILALVGPATGPEASVALFDRLYEAFGPGGHARVIAFLALEGGVPGSSPDSLRPLAEATHAARVAHHKTARRVATPQFEDTYFTVLLASLALFGEAIVGPLFRGEDPEEPDRAIAKRFRAWLARLVLAHLES